MHVTIVSVEGKVRSQHCYLNCTSFRLKSRISAIFASILCATQSHTSTLPGFLPPNFCLAVIYENYTEPV